MLLAVLQHLLEPVCASHWPELRVLWLFSVGGVALISEDVGRLSISFGGGGGAFLWVDEPGHVLTVLLLGLEVGAGGEEGGAGLHCG
jgi:hypothetical protein